MSNTTKHVELNLLDMTYEETLEEVQFISHRSNLAVYIECPSYEDKHSDEETKIVLQIEARWGHPLQWIEMTPGEARILSRMLSDHAQQVEMQSFTREPEDAS